MEHYVLCNRVQLTPFYLNQERRALNHFIASLRITVERVLRQFVGRFSFLYCDATDPRRISIPYPQNCMIFVFIGGFSEEFVNPNYASGFDIIDDDEIPCNDV